MVAVFCGQEVPEAVLTVMLQLCPSDCTLHAAVPEITVSRCNNNKSRRWCSDSVKCGKVCRTDEMAENIGRGYFSFGMDLL